MPLQPQKMKEKASFSLPQKEFTSRLLQWHRHHNKRQMPWKGEKNPYRIWLSEIILQQTRVEQGLAYYERFITHYPTVNALAAAPDAQVMKLWEGLGYYSRCRNLIATARIIAAEYNGIFPDSFDAIQSLKGIGPYTAAAIASFAYNLPHAVVDGNVYRVLARVWGIKTAIDSTAGKKQFATLAQALLDPKHAGLYNQAIMDFGATICKPQVPLCSSCVFADQCVALQKGLIAELPLKEKKNKIRKRWFYYFILEYKGQLAIQLRTQKDIWQHLYEFPLMEMDGEMKEEELIKQAVKKEWLKKGEYDLVTTSPAVRQLLSHQVITARFIHLRLRKKLQLPPGAEWVKQQDLATYAFPRVIRTYLDQVAG